MEFDTICIPENNVMYRMYRYIIRYHVDRNYVDILQNIMKIVDRIQKNHRMSVLHIIKTTDPLELITYHSVAPDIQILTSMMG